MRTATRSGTTPRSDAQITRDVLHRMKEDFEVPDDRIRVKVAGGGGTVAGPGKYRSAR